LEESHSFFEKAETLYKKHALSNNLAFLITHKAFLYIEAGKRNLIPELLRTGLSFLEEAYTLFEKIGLRQFLPNILYNLANGYILLGNQLQQDAQQEVYQLAEEALTNLSVMHRILARMSITTITYETDKQAKYELGFQLYYYLKKDYIKALLSIERMKSQSLVEMVAPSQVLPESCENYAILLRKYAIQKLNATSTQQIQYFENGGLHRQKDQKAGYINWSYRWCRK
jgi:hypothetical protein